MTDWNIEDFSAAGGQRQLSRAPSAPLTEASMADWTAWLRESDSLHRAAFEWFTDGQEYKAYFPVETLEELIKSVETMQLWHRGLMTNGHPARSNMSRSQFYGGR